MMYVIRVAALMATVAASFFARSAGPEVYRNEEFGITLLVPEETLLCPTPGNEHDHGPVMLLGTRNPKGCHEIERQRAIDVFASYNAVQATKTLDKFLRSECVDTFKGKCRPAPGGLQITGLPSKAARVNHPDGWIDIFVVTQAGKPTLDFDASVPSVNYDLSLRTRPEHLKEDLRIFRTVLETVQLSPGETEQKETSRTVSAATAEQQSYCNEEFGIAVPIPERSLLCVAPEHQHDHGPAFILEPPQPRACDDIEHGRVIVIFAGYNAYVGTKRLGDFFKWECANVVKGRCRPSPCGLQITGLPSMAGRLNHADGWIDIRVVTQAGKLDPDFDASVSLINYDLRLHSRARFLEKDLDTFRTALRTIQPSPE